MQDCMIQQQNTFDRNRWDGWRAPRSSDQRHENRPYSTSCVISSDIQILRKPTLLPYELLRTHSLGRRVFEAAMIS